MNLNELYFDLPEELIAQTPSTDRGQSRLLVFDRKSGAMHEDLVSGLAQYLPESTLLVFNNSRVRKARVYGQPAVGQPVEFLFLKKISPFVWEAITSKSSRQKAGKTYIFDGGVEGEIEEDLGQKKIVRFSTDVPETWFETYGHIPLPPYIKREDIAQDSSRYQTVYSDPVGSAAAPTAGLHFTEAILAELKLKGIQTAFVTLHVGMGTFLPVRSENVEDHIMHREEYEIPQETADLVNRWKSEGKPVMAVGTTSVRTLESAYKDGALMPGSGSTDIFIQPGYKFKVADHLMTNFHTPYSTLLLLVGAFAGMKNIKAVYQHAIEKKYRFFSYGDACLFL